MSDLISRSELLEEIKSLSIVLNGKQIFSDDAKDTILRIINEQPTAYSVDKAVDELEKAKTINVDVGFGTIYKTIRKDVAIEIVKQGGVSDDVCKWTSTQINNEWKPSCEPNSTYNVFGVAWFRKCPYCGKKIKIVGD